MHLTAIIVSAFAIAAGIASIVHGPERLDERSIEERQNDRFTIQYWENDYAGVDWTNGPGGQFNLTWNNGFAGNFVIGKGYNPSRDMLFNYSGTFSVASGSFAYLTLYGWTRNPLVEWYVIEAMGAHNPSDNASALQYGTVESDGATYEVWQKERINAPSIDGDKTNFQQYWSVRTSMHCGGTINTGNHWRAWEKLGLKLGTHQYMALAIEGQAGRGSADLTAGVLPTTSVKETPTPTQRTETRTRTSLPPTGTTSSSSTRVTTTSSTRVTSTSTRVTSSTRPTSTTTRRTTSSSTRRTTSSTTRRTTSAAAAAPSVNLPTRSDRDTVRPSRSERDTVRPERPT